MKERFRRLIDAVDAADHEVVIRKAISDFTTTMGYHRFAYLQATGPEIKTFTNYPSAWQKIYLRNGLSVIDPVVEKAKRLKRTFLWTVDDWKGEAFSKEVRAFRDLAIQHGLRSGMTIPVEASYGRILMLTLASPTTDPHDDPIADPVTPANAVLAIHYNLVSVADIALVQPRKLLSPREAVCLRWCAKGMNVPDIAGLMNLSTRTVQGYNDSTRKKLGASTLAHAVAIGMEQKLL